MIAEIVGKDVLATVRVIVVPRVLRVCIHHLQTGTYAQFAKRDTIRLLLLNQVALVAHQENLQLQALLLAFQL